MKEMDSHAINKIGIPSIVLMENAALKIIENINLNNCSTFTVICGTGNNGGDGLAVARHLILKHKNVSLHIIGDIEKGSADFKINLNILNNLHTNINNIKDEKDILKLKEDLQSNEITIDAIFGIGLTRNVDGVYYEIIQLINEKSKQIISVDIPSGLNGDTGEAMGIAIKAHKTITFHMMKKGLALDRKFI